MSSKTAITEGEIIHSPQNEERRPEPVSIVIFGATGDLTARKLVPALYALDNEGLLPQVINIVGFARRPWSDQEFRQKMYSGVSTHGRYIPNEDGDEAWDSFEENLFYSQGNFDDVEAYRKLNQALKDKAAEQGMPDNRLYYLAAPPNFYEMIVGNLGEAGMAESGGDGWRRIIIEKPFGHNRQTAKKLNQHVQSVFDEQQVYRIDHYLGKETVQNILVMRFANAIFEPIWNQRYVDHVQISVAESVGVGSRAGFYDSAGVVRDIFQNHILQVLSLIAMEPPVAYEANAIRDEKVKVLRAVRPIPVKDVSCCTVRAQYVAGEIDGKPVSGYRDENGVPDGSTTPTFAAIEWYIDNWRWRGVPFYVRSGKRMPLRATEVSIHFKRPPHLLFGALEDPAMRANVLTLRVQPDEGISLQILSKLPGQGLVRQLVTMDFNYSTAFGIADPPAAYERLLLDAMLGDATLFARSDEIELAWGIVDPILEGWEMPDAAPVEMYAAGTWGAEGATLLIEDDTRRWQELKA